MQEIAARTVLWPDVRWWAEWANRFRVGAFFAACGFQTGALILAFGLLDGDVIRAALVGEELGWTPERLWARDEVRLGVHTALVSVVLAGLLLVGWAVAHYLAVQGGWYLLRLRRRAARAPRALTSRELWRRALTIEGAGGGWRPETVHRYLDTFGAEDLPDEELRAWLRELREAMKDAEDLARDQIVAGARVGEIVPRAMWAGHEYYAEDLLMLVSRAAERCREVSFRSPPDPRLSSSMR